MTPDRDQFSPGAPFVARPPLLIRHVTLIDGHDDGRGTVAPGTIAGLLLADADPSTDIRNRRRNRFIIKDGRGVHTRPGAVR